MKTRKTSSRTLIIAVLAAIILCAGGVLYLWSYDLWYEEKIMPGVVLGTIPVGGYSINYARDITEGYHDRLRTQGALFHFKGKRVVLYPRTVPLNSDIPLEASTQLFNVDTDATVADLAAVGRTGTMVESQLQRVVAATQGTVIPPTFSLDERAIVAELKKEFSFFNSPAQDARFSLENDMLVIVPESRGISFDYARAITELSTHFSTLSMPVVELREGQTFPSLTARDIEGLRDRAQKLTADALTLSFHDTAALPQKKYSRTIPREILVSWLRVTRGDDQRLALSFNADLIAAYLTERIAPEVRVDVIHPRFEIKEGRVVAFDVPRDGRTLDVENTVVAILASLDNRTVPTVLSFTVITSPYQTTAAGQPVITDLLGRGETSFAGSPQNRRKNIARGSQLLNGILLSPGEEFSTIKALGIIDDTNGFLPELVIKGDKTTPEFGGGLCQVSTTLFRAVSFAGLEILERKNHSYRVSYYEPPVGFDATIYDPAPDFKFKNDTNNHILVQARTTGNTMIVELWGVRDGRVVEVDKPRVFNIKKSVETKFVETDELPPGEKKCIERAHDGADAIFERRITYADGTTKKETYKSHYVVWPAVCLVGRKKIEPGEMGSGSISNPPATGVEIVPDPISPPPSLQQTP